MIKQYTYRLLLPLLLATIVLTSCQPASSSSGLTTNLPSDNNLPETGQTSLPTISETAPEPTLTPNGPTPTPIVETRLPPERWQEWPVVPELTGRETAIYQRGLALGNDPTHFSKVGDCQAIRSVLMGIYDQPDRYILRENDSYLQDTIDNFGGSFNRDGQGVRGGFNTAAVLSPLWADPQVCQPGETPIACENRIHNPSMVIISLEVWWEGRTVERYETYLRQIIEYFIDEGVVPILSTKADNVEGDHRINLATARLAYEYHIPLWNFWLAVQPMPNHGLDPTRDGFHISYEAWTVRSYTALQALDAVWRGVQDSSTTDQVLTPSSTPSSEFAPILFAPPVATLTARLSGEHYLFSIEQRSGDDIKSAGVFAYDPLAQTLYDLLPAGFRLEDVDPSGQRLLVSQDNQLYLSDLDGNLQPLTTDLAETSQSASAYWLPDGVRFLTLTGSGEDRSLMLNDTGSSSSQTIASGPISAIQKPTSNEIFTWYQGECESDTTCADRSIWQNRGGNNQAFANGAQTSFAFDNSVYAWIEMTDGETLILYTRHADQTQQDYIYLSGNRSPELSWSPTDLRLVVLTVIRSEYSGKSSDAQIVLVDSQSLTSVPLGAITGLNPSLFWAPDGSALLLTSTTAEEDGYRINLRRLDLSSGIIDFVNANQQITSEGFLTIDRLYWINP